MIESFKCDDTQKLFHDRYVKCFERVERAARRKLEMLDAASDINDLRTPPGNR
ncbi:MAG: type II toxin-antitoxin system RelE/ParE family toxin, partial [Bdellovibrionales bacterium]